MFGEKIPERLSTPSAKNPCDVNKDANELYERKIYIFHLVTTKLLFITKHVIPDIDP